MLRRKEMKLLMYILIPITLIVTCLSLIFFADDVYRYPCMDPANWNTVECDPPQCEAMGLCTKYLIDIPPEAETITSPVDSNISENQDEK